MKLKLLALAALLAVGGCASSGANSSQAAGTPINKFCAVNTTDTVDPKVTVMYMGQAIGFCCSDCIEMFKKDPEKYMKGLK